MEDFESLPEFQALVVAATTKPERSMGDSVIPAEPPQWGEVRSLAKSLAKTAADQLALHVYLVQAEANVKGFIGLRQSLGEVLQLLENQWDSMYPSPDLDDPDDMYYARVNLMNELSEQPSFLDALHRLPLVSVRGLGQFSTRDIEISLGQISGSEEDKARCQEGLIRGAFAESDVAELQSLAESLAEIPQVLVAIENLFSEKTGQSGVLSLSRLRDRVNACRSSFNEFAADHIGSAPAEESAEAQVSAEDHADEPMEVKSRPLKASSLTNRQMVMESFDAILLYYQVHEPSSPVRILTFQARGFVNKSFFEVLQALAPAHKEDLPTLLAELQKQPIAALLGDSYARYLAGESMPALDSGGASARDGGQPLDGEDESHAAAGESTAGNNHGVRVIESREEVLALLQDIETYFTVAEPASPIPLIIADIRKLVSKRFVELVTEFSRLIPLPT